MHHGYIIHGYIFFVSARTSWIHLSWIHASWIHAHAHTHIMYTCIMDTCTMDTCTCIKRKSWKHLETINFGNLWVKGDSLSRKTFESDNEEYYWRREMLAMQTKWQFVSNSGPIKKGDIYYQLFVFERKSRSADCHLLELQHFNHN